MIERNDISVACMYGGFCKTTDWLG